MNLKPVHEQVVVLTGASSGIGLATAHAFAEKGARLVLVARNAAALETVAAELRAKGGQAEVCTVDIADPHAAERIAATAMAAFGRVDTWVNDAAAAVYGRLDQVPEADHRRVFEVGYWGTVRGSLKAIELMRARGGALINVGSVLSERAILQQGPYCAMKHALRGFTDALRAETIEAGHPVSITLIKPAAIHTPYPEHARNYMDKPGTVPPINYDPRLVARAIVFAAEHPRRELTVGGNGLMISKIGNIFPGAMDFMQAAFLTPAQKIDKEPPAGVNDNLYEPRADGRIENEQGGYVRRTSLWLEAQMYPARAVGVIGAGVLAVALLATAKRR